MFLWEYKIRTAREAPCVRNILVTEGTYYLCKDSFWSSILAPYAPHVFTSLFSREFVHTNFLDCEVEGKIGDVAKTPSLD
jgi:hypothetical protein